MTIQTLFEQTIDGAGGDFATLSDEAADELVQQLKQEVDSYWLNDANRSVELADQIIAIGRARNNLEHVALGMMARGDSLRFLGKLHETWQHLEEAGDLFRQAGNEVGWARTRIGRLAVSADLLCADEALDDVPLAREIFMRLGEFDKLLRLENNTGFLLNLLGRHNEAIDAFEQALEVAEAMVDESPARLARIYLNIGVARYYQGEFELAAYYYHRAYDTYNDAKQFQGCAFANLNLAMIEQARGNHREALRLLHLAQDVVCDELPQKCVHTRIGMIECYLNLNRYVEARELAIKILTQIDVLDSATDKARLLLFLAIAEVHSGNFDAAQEALQETERIYQALDADTGRMIARIRQQHIALATGGDAWQIFEQMESAEAYFERHNLKQYQAEAFLIRSQSALTIGNLAGAIRMARQALNIAKSANIFTLRYSAYLLLACLFENQISIHKALRYYRAAEATIERVQRGLTITLRPGFMEDKLAATHAQIRLYLGFEDEVRAFETLERAKAQIFLGYLNNQDQMHWATQTAESASMVEELNQLRQQHHWLYQQINHTPFTLPDEQSPIDREQHTQELASCERRMRAISERLYLYQADEGTHHPTQIPSLTAIQARIKPESMVIVYYDDGERYWAFTLDPQSVKSHPLPIKTGQVQSLIQQLQFNIKCALNAGSQSKLQAQLTRTADQLTQQLYAGLIQPLEMLLKDKQTLTIVPYGALHYLPFHILHTGSQYLIERFEVSILPTASLLLQPVPCQQPGARVLAHSWGGRLPHTANEAQLVHELFDGDLLIDADAECHQVQASPTQILHIAAHGEYRIDQPDLSYINLEDGHVFTDDLLQNDMRYELVTLSACETGRARVAGGDELIGLGRGFLYAGAGALLVSLWQVHDETTTMFMKHFYQALKAGDTKIAALRSTYHEIMQHTQSGLHPAFWGAFQLVGNTEPLSQFLKS